MDEGYKEVYFHEYCEKCKHNNPDDPKGLEEPCNECLDHPTNLYSHKPVKFEEK